MAYCSGCGHQLQEGDRFCSRCGKEVNQPVAQAQPVSRCPRCGMLTSPMVITCVCGYEFHHQGVSSAAQEFLQQLETIEHQAVSNWEQFSRFINSSATAQAERKAELIRSFVVPNTKQDIFEFLLMAYSNIDKSFLHAKSNIFSTLSNTETKSLKLLTQAWKSKFDQLYQKAKIAFGRDADFDQIQEMYNSLNHKPNTKRTL